MSDKVLNGVPRELLERIDSQMISEGMAPDDELRALLTAQPQASATQSAPATVATGNLRAVLAMVLQALDRDAAEGRAVRGEMAEELRAAMAAQSAPAGEREAFEAWWKLDAEGSENKAAAYEGWKARAAYSQGATANEREAFRSWCESIGYPASLMTCGDLTAFKAGAAWQRTQSAPVVQEGFALVDVAAFRSVLDRSDWRTAGNRAELRAMLAAATAQPAAEDQPEKVAHSAQWPTTPGLSARPSDDDLWDQTLSERDSYHESADKLTDAIAKHFGQDFGEHSNLNAPWENALEFVRSLAAQSSPDEPEVQRLREALEEVRPFITSQFLLDRIDAALAASTGQEVGK